MKTKIIIPHKKNCLALEQVAKKWWPTPWAYITAEALYLDSIGRKGGNRRWNVIICNDSQCPAKIAVREDDVLNQLPHE